MRSQLIIATTLFLSGTFAWGQEPSKRWSLEECIRYAIEHNIDLKQKEQDQESRRVELHTNQVQLVARSECQCRTELRLWTFSFQIRCDCGSELG